MRLALVLLAGCGRIGFDAGSVDAVAACTGGTGHDEDGDLVDDACDVCPHMQDDGSDRDGDGVGDVCDPNPDVARDHIVFFDPFTTQSPAWHFASTVNAQARYVGDAAEMDSRGGQFRGDLSGAPVDDTYAMGVHVGVGDPTRQHQIAMYALQSDKALYFCDLDSEQGVDSWQETYTRNGTDYFRIAGGAANRTVENGELVMRMRVTPGPPHLQCETTWPVETRVLDGDAPAGIVPVEASFSFIGVDVEVEWFVHIASTPP